MALPSLLTAVVDRTISRLESMKSSTDAISGYSLALGACVSATRFEFHHSLGHISKLT